MGIPTLPFTGCEALTEHPAQEPRGLSTSEGAASQLQGLGRGAGEHAWLSGSGAGTEWGSRHSSCPGHLMASLPGTGLPVVPAVQAQRMGTQAPEARVRGLTGFRRQNAPRNGCPRQALNATPCPGPFQPLGPSNGHPAHQTACGLLLACASVQYRGSAGIPAGVGGRAEPSALTSPAWTPLLP